MKTKNECRIIVCPECDGKGKIEERINLYDSGYVDCQYCDGKRVVIEREIITHEKLQN